MVVLRQLGAFKRSQNFASYGGGVLDALKTWRISRPFVAAKVRMLRAGCDHEIVVSHLAKLRSNKSFFGIYAKNFFHQNSGVALGTQNVPDRPRNIRRRKGGRSHLIEQRLKAMVIVPVDNHDLSSGTP